MCNIKYEGIFSHSRWDKHQTPWSTWHTAKRVRASREQRLTRIQFSDIRKSMPCPIIFKTHDPASLWRTVPPRDRSFQEIFRENWLNWNVQEKTTGLTTWHYYNTQCKFLISPLLRKKSMVEREARDISAFRYTQSCSHLVMTWASLFWRGLYKDKRI